MADLPAVVGPRLSAGEHNPDGIHFAWSTHADVAAALVSLIRPRLP